MRSAPSVITGRGFGSEAAIRRGDRHRRALWPVRVDERGPQREAEGRGRGRAETEEVRTLDLERSWAGMRPRTARTAGRSAAPPPQGQKRTGPRFHQGHLPIGVLWGFPEAPGAGCLHEHPCSAAD